MLVNLSRAAAAALALALPAATAAEAAPVVFQAAGPNAPSIQGTVDAYRAELGTLNANEPGSRGSGRRESNWDGVPDDFSDANPFPPDFFNANLSGRARGAVFSRPSGGFLVSADADNPTHTPARFRSVNPTYGAQFATFSPERLFTAAPKAGKGNVTDVAFFIPGKKTRAATTGFGAVFTDVDLRQKTKLEFFDRQGRLLRRQFVPHAPGAKGLSFAGVAFDKAVVWRVRITSGNVGLGPNDAPGAGRDVAVMDDFIYGEPVQP